MRQSKYVREHFFSNKANPSIVHQFINARDHPIYESGLQMSQSPFNDITSKHLTYEFGN